MKGKNGHKENIFLFYFLKRFFFQIILYVKERKRERFESQQTIFFVKNLKNF